jgi:hypothetical protein
VDSHYLMIATQSYIGLNGLGSPFPGQLHGSEGVFRCFIGFSSVGDDDWGHEKVLVGK